MPSIFFRLPQGIAADHFKLVVARLGQGKWRGWFVSGLTIHAAQSRAGGWLGLTNTQ
jgi:hypothetical protein